MTAQAENKTGLRQRMKVLRAQAHAAQGPGAAAALAEQLGPLLPARLGLVSQPRETLSLAGYWPIHSEIDPRPAMRASGARLLLPIVAGRDQPLDFAHWQEGDPLTEGLAGCEEPLASAAHGVPDCLLVPGLAFDRKGYRLGYGGGYYDRTLARLRARGTVLAIGVCYSVQLIDHLPHEAHDQPVDVILTPQGTLVPAP